MSFSVPVYCTREDVKTALDSMETARNNTQVDRAVEAGARTIDGMTPGAGFLGRRFYPEQTTRYFDWPNEQRAYPWRLWLDANELISVTSLTSGGVTIPSSDYFLRPENYGPPYRYIELNLAGQSAFAVGATYQRSIVLVGLFGYRNDEETAGALAAAVSTTTGTTVDVTDSSAIGVGQLLRVDTERMIVVERWPLTTGQTLQTPLTASKSNDAVAVSDGTAYGVGEIIVLDSESMKIVDINGNTLTVKRAWDGSTLATHTGSTIYARRRLTVKRGVLGTVAATHSNAAAVNKHITPGLVRDLNVAEALAQLVGEGSGYSPIQGRADRASGKDKPVTLSPLEDIRARALASYGRRVHARAV